MSQESAPDTNPSPEQAAPQPAPVPPGLKKAKPGRKRKGLLVLAVIACIGCFIGLKMYINAKTRIETDNAFIEASTVSVSARITGTVKRVEVRDNQFVRKGDLLVEIDPQDYRIQVDRAAAGVVIAENETGGDRLKSEAARASLQSARVRHEQAQLDMERGEKLFKREVIPREQYDRLTTSLKVAESQVREAEDSYRRARAEAGIGGTIDNKAKIRERRALLSEAEQRYSYTRVYAPCDGYITRKSVETGANIQVGQPLMALVPLQEAWITANYKERQITHIRPGQQVDFTVDAYPGRRFSGRVDSIMAGTGAAFSLLPPENATGNYVKVIQRIPVKIAIDSNTDPDHLLRVGMSVVPTVMTGRRAADVLSEMNPFR